MKKTFPLLMGIALLLGAATFRSAPPKDWEPLLDKSLSKWQTFQSHRHVPGDKGLPPVDAQGKTVPPIGYGKNEANVFSVVMQKGEPVLRISGEIYGCIFTKQDFTNYDLKLKVKWGQQKWLPRLNDPRDSGILYNSQGECGVDYWHSWMLSQEFQVSEYQKGNAMGDFWCIANSAADITARRVQDTLRFDPGSAAIKLGDSNAHFCYAASPTHPQTEWTELELINVNGQSLHIVNGQVVMAVNNSSYLKDGQRQPLTQGKIQLQSEAAEVFYKGIQIKPLAAMPAQYAKYFVDK